MKRLWICLTLLAIYGNLAYINGREEQNDDRDKITFDSLEESKDVNNNKSLEDSDLPDDKVFKMIKSDNTYYINQDYQFEDNRSELNEDIADDDNSFLNTEKDTRLKQDTTHLSSTEHALLQTTKMYTDSDKTNNTKMDGEKNKQETTKKVTVKAFANLMAELDELHETWDKLNNFDEYTGGGKDQDDSSSEGIFTLTVTDDYINEKLDISNKVTGNYSPLKKETANPILYVNDALPASETISVSTESIFIEQKQVHTDALRNMLRANRNLFLGKADTSSTAALTITSEDTAFTDQKKLNSNETELVKNAQITRGIKNLTNKELITFRPTFISSHKVSKITENDKKSAKKIIITSDRPTVITSPHYPSPYPNNSITDWMFTGQGGGIQLNIMDLAINGERGDYLLFNPGGTGEVPPSDLILSYTITEKESYWFADVDNMFVRFETKPGKEDMHGFKFSLKMRVQRQWSTQPDPELKQVIPEPPETITLNLGGISLDGFIQIEETFRQIVADMAELYLIDNGIDPGINTTLEITQIRSKAICFHNWPKFELCAEVRFGVPLVYHDEENRKPRLTAADLTQMWETYSQDDKFDERLKSLGITEYQVPNDMGVLIMWLVIAGGIVVTMAMFAFALWRYSCFKDYTRMAFSDTGSIKEKRNLDLSPTQNHTLPPLYSETDYKWADAKCEDFTKVHIGGYSNESYLRDDLYDLDSDEDIIPANARNTSFSPRDIDGI